MSTGAILLADVVPAILVKMTAPFIVVCINTKVWIVTILSGFSFILVSISHVHSLTIIGVVCASIGSGLGHSFTDRHLSKKINKFDTSMH